MTRFNNQNGTSLIEVMIALAILLMMALATSKGNVNAYSSARMSNVHFSVEYLSSDIIEILRSDAEAASEGQFNFDAAAEAESNSDSDADSSSDSSSEQYSEVHSWNERVKSLIPEGEGGVSCTGSVCAITISWMEEIDGSYHRLVYNASTPL